MKSWIRPKSSQIRLFILELCPLIAEKAKFLLFHQHNFFSFNPIFLKDPEKVETYKILHELHNWQIRLFIFELCSLIAEKAEF